MNFSLRVKRTAGCLPQDPAPGYDPKGLASAGPTLVGSLHLAVAGVATAFVRGPDARCCLPLVGQPAWQGWAIYTHSLTLVMIVGIAVYGALSTWTAGFAVSFERIAILIPAIWGASFMRCLWMGRAFMQALRESGPHEAL